MRASTAAPVYFSPEVIQWDPDEPAKSFAFVDGGTTAYNCPALLLARMVTEPAYGLGWPRGERKLGIVSIGTGAGPALGMTAEDPHTNLVSAAVTTLGALMSQAMYDQDINCRTIGRCVYGPPLDREVGDLVPRDERGRRFRWPRTSAGLPLRAVRRGSDPAGPGGARAAGPRSWRGERAGLDHAHGGARADRRAGGRAGGARALRLALDRVETSPQFRAVSAV